MASSIKDALSSAAEALNISDKKAAAASSSSTAPESSTPTGKGLELFVDETAGSDTTGDGSKANPFATPLAALLAKGSEATLLVKKNSDGSAPKPAEGEQPSATDPDGFAPISGAAGKKAKKAYDAEMKKRAKQAEREAADAKQKGLDESRLEDAKKIVLPVPDKKEYQKVSTSHEAQGGTIS